MFLRLHLAFPVIRDMHPIFINRREICKNTRFSATATKATFGTAACIKTTFYHYPVTAVLVAMIVLGGAATFSVLILERDYHAPSSHISYIYLALITMTTVGYGDYAPISPLGRAACVFTALVGIIMTAFIINIISQSLQLKPLEKEAADWTTEREQDFYLRDLSATFVQHTWHHYVNMKHTVFATASAKKRAENEFKIKSQKTIKRIRVLRRKMTERKIHSQDPVLDQLLAIDKMMAEEIAKRRTMEAKMDKLVSLLETLVTRPRNSTNPSRPVSYFNLKVPS